jgi:hypothetical protein
MEDLSEVKKSGRHDYEKELERFQIILNNPVETQSRANYEPWLNERPKTTRERTADAEARKKEAEADDAEGDIKLKKMIAYVIIGILIAQSGIVFWISVSQGLKYLLFRGGAFDMEEWSFRILVSATLIQTYYLMRIVVSYLFPRRDVPATNG